jgi:hypothetical protein
LFNFSLAEFYFSVLALASTAHSIFIYRRRLEIGIIFYLTVGLFLVAVGFICQYSLLLKSFNLIVVADYQDFTETIDCSYHFVKISSYFNTLQVVLTGIVLWVFVLKYWSIAIKT